MGKDVPPLSLGDFKLVPILLLVNIAGFSVILWPLVNTGGITSFTIYFSLGFFLLWGVLTFVFKKGTTFLQFIFLWLVSSFMGIIAMVLLIKLYIQGSNLNAIITIPSIACCISFGIILFFRKYQKVKSNPAFLFSLSTWSWLLAMAFFIFFGMNTSS